MSLTPHGGLNDCRCFSCRVAKAEWERERVKAAKEGRPYTCSCADSAARLELFLRAGFTYKAIGRALTTGESVLKRIVEEPDGVMLRSTQERIMNLRVSDIEPGRTSAVGAMRMLRDLSLLGWQAPRIAEESGLSENTIRNVVLGRTKIINGDTDRIIRSTFERLSREEPPDDSKARSWAKKSEKRGWKRIAAFPNPDRRMEAWEVTR